jgi:cardiolipin synthase A/B
MDMGDFSTWAGLYVFSEWIIRLVMLAAVPFRRSAEAAKGWLLLILFLPWPGLLLYVLIGRPQLPGWRLAQIKRLRQVLSPVVERLLRHPKIFHPCIDPKLEPAVTLAENLGHLPIFGSNSAELLADYNGTIDRLVADIDRAKHHVHRLRGARAGGETGRFLPRADGRARLAAAV